MCIVAKEVAKISLFTARAYTHQPACPSNPGQYNWGSNVLKCCTKKVCLAPEGCWRRRRWMILLFWVCSCVHGVPNRQRDLEDLDALNERNNKMERNAVVQMLCHAAGKQQEESSKWAELEIQEEKKTITENCQPFELWGKTCVAVKKASIAKNVKKRCFW